MGNAQIAGFMLRATDRTATAEFYRKLGLTVQAHEHGGPIHFELGPIDENFIVEIYLATYNFPKDAVMVKVPSLDTTFELIEVSPEVRDVADMRLAYVEDPDGRAVMLYEVVGAEATANTGLAGEHCLPCDCGIPALDAETIEKYLGELDGWKLSDGHLVKTFIRKNFVDSMLFGAAIAPIAEFEQHHPDFAIHDYIYVEIRLITKAINALSINDFIVAAKIDKLVK